MKKIIILIVIVLVLISGYLGYKHLTGEIKIESNRQFMSISVGENK